MLALAGGDAALLAPLVPGLPYLRVEAIWAARREMARTLDDVLARRTRALILDREATVAAAGGVARLLAAELGWDESEQARQVADFHRVVEAERRAADPRDPSGPSSARSATGAAAS